MFRRASITCWLAILSTGWVTALAHAQSLPPDRTARFRIHSDPSDPSSPVAWDIALNLKAINSHGGYVGWEVDSIDIAQRNSSGTVIARWRDSDPTVPSMDGLWYVRHADTADPQINEFVMPPLFNGRASAVSGSSTATDYSFSGVPYEAPPGGPPYGGHVAALDFIITLDGGTEPEDDGDDEPVEVSDTGL